VSLPRLRKPQQGKTKHCQAIMLLYCKECDATRNQLPSAFFYHGKQAKAKGKRCKCNFMKIPYACIEDTWMQQIKHRNNECFYVRSKQCSCNQKHRPCTKRNQYAV